MTSIDKSKLPKNIKGLIKMAEVVFPFGTHSRAIFAGITVGGTKIMCKLVVYRKSPGLIKNSPVETEINIFNVLMKQIVEPGLSNCIGILIGYTEPNSVVAEVPSNCIDIKTQRFSEQNPRDFIYNAVCRFADEIREGIMVDRYRILFFEFYDYSLYRFCQNYVRDNIFGVYVLKCMLFEIIYTLLIIEKTFPKFRHYDLHTSNILIYADKDFEFDPRDQKYRKYQFGDICWYIPDFGLWPKLIDFGMSQIPTENLKSSEIEEFKMEFYQPPSDILYLIHDINRAVYNEKLDKMFQAIDPANYYRHSDPQFLRDTGKFLTTEEIIKLDIFDDFKEAPAKNNITRIFKWPKN